MNKLSSNLLSICYDLLSLIVQREYNEVAWNLIEEYDSISPDDLDCVIKFYEKVNFVWSEFIEANLC